MDHTLHLKSLGVLPTKVRGLMHLHRVWMVTESLSERCFSSPWPPPPAPRPGFVLPEELHPRVSRGSVQAEGAGGSGVGGSEPPLGQQPVTRASPRPQPATPQLPLPLLLEQRLASQQGKKQPNPLLQETIRHHIFFLREKYCRRSSPSSPTARLRCQRRLLCPHLSSLQALLSRD